MFIRKLAAVAIVAAATGAGFATPADAASLRPHCSDALIKSANHHRHLVVKATGMRSAGRNIVRDGIIGRNQHAHRASCKSVRKYRDQLIVLHAEPKHYPLVAKVATTHYTAPAGVATSTVTADAPPANGTLAAIRSCESGGHYSTDTGNGFYGAYQFTLSTWRSVGGTGNPAAASRAEQDARAAQLYAQQGSAPWPVCGR